MASLRQIRSRLRSIGNTKQIMRAMQLVSASKLKRAQNRLVQARSMLDFLDGLLQRLLAQSGGQWDHPLCARHEGAPSTLVVFTSDAGLCGAYNTNLIQLAEAHLRRDTLRRTALISIGKKGHRYLTKRGFQEAASYLDLAGRPNLAKAEEIGRTLMDRFLSGRTGSVDLLYPQFVSASTCRPTILRWLPIQLDRATQPPVPPVAPRARHSAATSTVAAPPAASVDYIFEPSAPEVLADLLPRWALAKFRLVMLEAFTSEHSARMIAMKNATDNAEELVTALTRTRNKIRQASITKEISEIVGTAEALK